MVACLTSRTVHFIFGLRPQVEPFHLLHYLAIASCWQVLQPDEIQLHVHHLPYGFYWDLARPLVTLRRIEPVSEVDALAHDPEVVPYLYAHHADVIRLDVLATEGGMYADIDTLFVRPVPDEWWAVETIIGREAPVTYADSAQPEDSVSNALMMARPDSRFIQLWRDRIVNAMDGTWSEHSCRLATGLADDHPEWVRVEPQSSFCAVEHAPNGIRDLLEGTHRPELFERSYSVHLCAHLWWAVERRDFTSFSAIDVTEDHIRRSDSNLASLARPFLPSHGLF